MTRYRCSYTLALLIAATQSLNVQAGDSGAGAAAAGKGIVEVPGATIGSFSDSGAVDPDSLNFSPAESQLWLSNQLGNINRPARLFYQFKKSGSYEKGFSDSVFLDVLKINPDGTRDTDLKFFTGERQQAYGPNNVTGVRGNPILGIYMRGDVLDLNRLTEGNWRYFQRRIKLALAESAKIEPVDIEYGDKVLKGRRIVITPFVDDPRRSQFAQFAGKRYEFVLSDDIPGTVYEIHTIIPGESGDTEPLIEERLTLKQVNFGS